MTEDQILLEQPCPNCGGQLVGNHFYDAVCMECEYEEFEGVSNLDDI